jgi:hypothetical protein
MIRLALFLVLVAATAAHAEERRKFYGPNGEYKGQCIEKAHGITDCYDKNGVFVSRSVSHESGGDTIKEFYGKNLGKPTGREVITK